MEPQEDLSTQGSYKSDFAYYHCGHVELTLQQSGNNMNAFLLQHMKRPEKEVTELHSFVKNNYCFNIAVIVATEAYRVVLLISMVTFCVIMLYFILVYKNMNIFFNCFSAGNL